jgi:Autographiviridae endonuclease VII
MLQLNKKSLKHFRNNLLIEQNNTCLLCGELIQINPVIDHDHKTGQVRGILHRWCNYVLGKLEKAASRSGKKDFLKKAVIYLEKGSIDVLYPKKVKRKRKTRGKRNDRTK